MNFKMSSLERHEELEKEFKKRYGKDAAIFKTDDFNDDKTFKQITYRFESPQGKHFVITEVYKGNTNDTDYCLMCYTRDDRKFEHRFYRFLDAEVKVADLLAEELDGDLK